MLQRKDMLDNFLSVENIMEKSLWRKAHFQGRFSSIHRYKKFNYVWIPNVETNEQWRKYRKFFDPE